MGVTLVAHTAVGDKLGPVTSGVDTTGATLLVIAAGGFSNGGSVSVSDNKGNTFSTFGLKGNGSTTFTQIFYCLTPTVGTGHTVSMTGSVFMDLLFAAFGGGTFTVDSSVNTGTNNTGSSSIQPGSATPSANGDLLITSLSVDVSGISGVGSGFTITDTVAYSGGNYEGGGLAYLVQTTAAAINPTWSLSAANAQAAALCGFKFTSSSLTGTASLAATLGLAASATVPKHATAALAGTVAIVAAGSGVDRATASLSARVVVTASGTMTSGPRAALHATLGLIARSTQTQHASTTITGTLLLTARGSVEGAPGSAILAASLAFTATSIVIPPVYSPIGDTHTIRYWLTTLDPQPFGSQPNTYPIAELPFTNVSFTKTFNQAGPFSATLNIEDEQVVNSDWIRGTNPGKTFFWVLIDNIIVYGGRIQTRTPNYLNGTITITGSDFYGYWPQRVQAADYTAKVQNYSSSLYTKTFKWAISPDASPSGGAPAPLIAWQILRDAAAVDGSLPNLTVPYHGEGPGTKSDPDSWIAGGAQPITFTAPESQASTVDALVQQLVSMGTGIGCDVHHRVFLDTDGNPLARCYVSWPRHGKTAAELGFRIKVLDLSTAMDMTWSEDATSQATGLIESTGAGGANSQVEVIDLTAINTHHYPLTQLPVAHTSTSPTAYSPHVLQTLLKGDQDLYTYPQLAPTVTLPIFANTGMSLIELLPLGDDISVFNPFERQGIKGLPSIAFPPKGFLATMRVVKADVTIADEGVSTMVLTLNPPPGDPSPPGYTTS